MGFGRYQNNRQYQQEDATRGLGTLALLTAERNAQMGKLGEIANDYGEGRASSKAAQLIGSGALEGMTPEETQAAIFQATNGRDMSEQGGDNVKNLLGMRGDDRENTWDEESATTLFGRQQARDAMNNAQANARQQKGFAHSESMQKLRGTQSNSLLSDEQNPNSVQSIKNNIDFAREAIASGQLSPEEATEQKKYIEDSQVELQFALANSGLNAGAQGALSKLINPKEEKTSTTAIDVNKYSTPSQRSTLNDNHRGLLRAGVRLMPVKEGKTWVWKFPTGEVATDINIAKKYPQI